MLAAMEIAMIQDKIVPIDQAKVSAHDRGLFFGDGVYEAIRSYNGRLWMLPQHMERMARSLAAIQIQGLSLDQIQQRVLRAFKHAQIPEAIVYFHITRGQALRAHVNRQNLQPQFFLTVRVASDNSQYALDGIAAISTADLRWRRCDIKSLNLLPNVLARMKAAQSGAQEAVLVDQAGRITEAAVSSVFAVVKNTLLTHPLNHRILPGITRQVVIFIAGQLGLEVSPQPFTVEQAYQGNELIVCGTGDGIRPVIKLDGRTIGTGRPGPVTEKIIRQFDQLTLAGHDQQITFDFPPIDL